MWKYLSNLEKIYEAIGVITVKAGMIANNLTRVKSAYKSSLKKYKPKAGKALNLCM